MKERAPEHIPLLGRRDEVRALTDAPEHIPLLGRRDEVRTLAEAPEHIPLLGRRDEVRTLADALRARKSCLITGPAGIGKTRLIQEALAVSRQPLLRVGRPGVLHGLLVELAERLSCPAGRFASVRQATSAALKPCVLDALRRAPRCVILENVGAASPPMYRFLQQLYHVPGVCLIVTAASRDSLGHLRKLLWDPREEIALDPLTRAEAADLFDAAARAYLLESFDLDAFRGQVLAAAQGNPGQILTMCRMACRPEYQDGRHIKFLPLRMDALTAFVR